MNKFYKVLPEYWNDWGVNSEEESIVDDAEIKRLANDWGYYDSPEEKLEELMEQVEEVHQDQF